MIVNKDKRFIFVHVPKVAGSSISHALGGDTGMFWAKNHEGKQLLIASHTYAREMKKFLGPDQYAQYFTFAFVRNPWDRLFSLYKYMTRSPEINKAEQWFDQDEAERRGFKWFLLENRVKTTRVNLYGTNIKICQQTTPQLEWLSEDDNLIVKFVGTYENIENDFEVVCETLKIDAELPWDNRQRDMSYTKVYDNEMIDFVAKQHKLDVDFFRYTFD